MNFIIDIIVLAIIMALSIYAGDTEGNQQDIFHGALLCVIFYEVREINRKATK